LRKALGVVKGVVKEVGMEAARIISLWERDAKETPEYQKIREAVKGFMRSHANALSIDRKSPYASMLAAMLASLPQNPQEINEPYYLKIIEELKRADEEWVKFHQERIEGFHEKEEELMEECAHKIQEICEQQDAGSKLNYLAATFLLTAFLPGVSLPGFLAVAIQSGNVVDVVTLPIKFIFNILGIDDSALIAIIDFICRNTPVIAQTTELIEFIAQNEVTGPLYQAAITLAGSSHIVELAIGAYWAGLRAEKTIGLRQELDKVTKKGEKESEELIGTFMEEGDKKAFADFKKVGTKIVNDKRDQSLIKGPALWTIETCTRQFIQGQDPTGFIEELEKLSPEFADAKILSGNIPRIGNTDNVVNLSDLTLQLTKLMDDNPAKDMRVAQYMCNHNHDQFSAEAVNNLSPEEKNRMAKEQESEAIDGYYEGKSASDGIPYNNLGSEEERQERRDRIDEKEVQDIVFRLERFHNSKFIGGFYDKEESTQEAIKSARDEQSGPKDPNTDGKGLYEGFDPGFVTTSKPHPTEAQGLDNIGPDNILPAPISV